MMVDVNRMPLLGAVAAGRLRKWTPVVVKASDMVREPGNGGGGGVASGEFLSKLTSVISFFIQAGLLKVQRENLENLLLLDLPS